MIAGEHAVTPFDLPALLGRKGAAREIGDAIDALIALMDDLDGDPDLEEDDPAGGDIVDEPHDAEEDMGADDVGELDEAEAALGIAPIADPSALREHCDRIRRTRCTRHQAWNGITRRNHVWWTLNR